MLHFSQIQNITFLQYSFRKLCTSFFSKYLHKDYYDWRKCELRAEIMTTEAHAGNGFQFDCSSNTRGIRVFDR